MQGRIELQLPLAFPVIESCKGVDVKIGEPAAQVDDDIGKLFGNKAAVDVFLGG